MDWLSCSVISFAQLSFTMPLFLAGNLQGAAGTVNV